VSDRSRVIRRIAPFLRPRAGALAVAVVCMLVLAVTTAAYAWLVGPLLRYLTGGEAESVEVFARFFGLDPATLDRTELLLLVPAAMLVLGLAKGVAYFGQFYLMGMIAQKVVRDLRERVFAHLLVLSPRDLASQRTGDLLARFGTDLYGIELALTYAFSSYLRDSLQVAVLVVACFLLDWRLSLVAFCVVPVAVVPLARLARKLRKTTKRGQESVGRLSGMVHEASAGIRVIQAYGMEEHLSRRFDAENRRWLGAQRKSLRSRGIAAPAMELVAVVGLAAALAYAMGAVGQGALLPSQLLSFLATLALIFQPAKQLGKVGVYFLQGVAGGERIFEVLDLRPTVAPRPGAVDLPPFREAIRFEEVSFAYGERRVLDGIDIEVRRGEVVALVGGSGAGKTTLANLLCRSFDPAAGRVQVDGHDLRDVTLPSLRRQLALVTQETVLFDDTVRANVAYGCDASDDEVREALRAARALDFVLALPKGLDTVIGERGVTLSGGQRQRLAIARALLRNAPILVLDEATSALDGESEREVQAALRTLLADRTALVIAHRLATVREATRILVLSGGKIVEEGTHEELLRRGGEYKRLHDLQGRAAEAAA
jgi:subfamily B ATP-binding cassette protein MsbA